MGKFSISAFLEGTQIFNPRLDAVFKLLFEDEELFELAQEDPIMEKARNRLERLSADEKKRIVVLNRQRDLMAWNDLMANKFASGKAEGRAEGRAEGKTEGKAETLLRLIETKFGPLNQDSRTKVQRAHESEVDAWLERLLFADCVKAIFGE